MWYVTRATGFVATALVVAALAWGFFFSARETGKRLKPAWWLDLHNGLGGLALIFTGLHVLASWVDSNSGIDLLHVVVPATDSWGITWGVVALYILAAVVFTSWPRRLSNRRWWRIIHLLSVGATVLALVHAYLSGSDTGKIGFQITVVLLSALAVYAVGLRLFSLQSRA